MLAADLINPKASGTGGLIWRALSRLVRCCLLASLLLPARAFACESAPPAIKDITLPRFYTDAAGSEVDPDAKLAHAAAVEPLRAFVSRVTSDADKAWTRTKLEARALAGGCAVSWIAAWAKDGALLGQMQTKQSEYQRKWDFGGLALAFLKVRHFASPEQRATIEPWLIKVAGAAYAFFDNPEHKRNNHWYWLGLGIGATALATGSEPHWQQARTIFMDAMRDIGLDGSIGHELSRQSRALYYHDFAAMPLVVLAELAAAKGEDWYAGKGAGLHRLAGLTLTGHADPSVFDRLAGVAQERPVRPPAGWPTLYRARFPEQVPRHLAQSKAGHRWLGGDVGVLSAVLKR